MTVHKAQNSTAASPYRSIYWSPEMAPAPVDESSSAQTLLNAILDRTEWMDYAACGGEEAYQTAIRFGVVKVDPETGEETGNQNNLFFPGRGAVKQTEAAKDICHGCPVEPECLKYALGLGNDLEGVWGGTSHKERKKILKERKNA